MNYTYHTPHWQINVDVTRNVYINIRIDKLQSNGNRLMTISQIYTSNDNNNLDHKRTHRGSWQERTKNVEIIVKQKIYY